MRIYLNKLKAATLLAVLATVWAAASASVPGADGTETRHGLLVSYKEDSFRDMAARRYDRSPFYMRIDCVGDSTTVKLPAEWRGCRVILGIDTPSDPAGTLDFSVNGCRLGSTQPGRCQWEITDYVTPGEKVSLNLPGLGDRPRHLYAYATPKRVYVGSYTLDTRLVPASTVKGKPSGEMKLDIVLGGISKKQQDIALEYMLFDDSRHQVAAGRADASPRLGFKATIPDIRPWNTESPERYMLAIILRDDRTGAHIQTVGTPIRFADMQGSTRGIFTLDGRPLSGRLAVVDPMPDSRSARELLAAQLHAGGANMAASSWADPDWEDICEAQGIIAFNSAEAPVDGITVDGSARQWGYLVRGFSPVAVELIDTLALGIDVTNRLDYGSLDDYRLDWELTDLRGVSLDSGKGIALSVNPGEKSRVTLGSSPLAASHGEALLNLNWRRVVDGVRIVDQQIEISSTAPRQLFEPKYQKLKTGKNMYQAKRTVVQANASAGRLDLLDLGGWEVDITGIGISSGGADHNAVYDKNTRLLTVGGVTYGIDIDGALIIDSHGKDISMTIPSDMAERIMYMGRGPGHSPASEPVNRARVSLNRSTPAIERDEHGMPISHSDTRYLVTANGSGTPVMRIDSSLPFEFSVSSSSPGSDVNLTLSGKGLIRIVPLRH